MNKYFKYKKKYLTLKKISNIINGGEKTINFKYENKTYEEKVDENKIIQSITDEFITQHHLQGNNKDYLLNYKDKTLNQQNKLNDYGINNYDKINIIKFNIVSPFYRPHILNYLIKKLSDEFIEGQQIMISLFSGNLSTHQGNEVEINQQIKFDKIDPNASEIIIILFDLIFFTEEYDDLQLYNLVILNNEELQDLENEDDNQYIKKYTKNKNDNFTLNIKNPHIEKYRKYFDKYNKDDKINKKISWYILRYADTGKHPYSDFVKYIMKYNMEDKINIFGYSE
jgi:hypothetical protein